MRALIITFAILLSQSISAQCYADRHNTTWFDSWVSCQRTENPNPTYGETHWIQYDLGYQYLLGEMSLWNINDPAHLDRGASELIVDISEDGESWTQLGVFDVLPASGMSIYEGETLMDFDGAQARFVLLTVMTNHGAQFCSGFSEMKIDVEGVVTDLTESISPGACFDVAVFPNPHFDYYNARIKTTCPDDLYVRLYDALGRVIYVEDLGQVSEVNLIELGDSELPPGMYHLTIQQGDALGRYQVVKAR